MINLQESFKRFRSNRKGDFQSIIIMIVVISILAIVSVIFAKGFGAAMDEFAAQDQIMSNPQAHEAVNVVQDRTIPLLDFFVFGSFVALILGVIISTIFINTHPAIAMVFVIALAVAVFLAGMFANVYGELSDDAELEDTIEEFKLTNLIMGSQFPIIILVIGIVVIIVFYGKSGKVGAGV